MPILLPARWSVTGMAGAYALSCLAGLVLTVRLLRRRTGGGLDDGAVRRAYTRLMSAAALAAALAWAADRACAASPGGGTAAAAAALTAGTATLGLGYVVLARLLRVTELRELRGPR